MVRHPLTAGKLRFEGVSEMHHIPFRLSSDGRGECCCAMHSHNAYQPPKLPLAIVIVSSMQCRGHDACGRTVMSRVPQCTKLQAAFVFYIDTSEPPYMLPDTRYTIRNWSTV